MRNGKRLGIQFAAILLVACSTGAGATCGLIPLKQQNFGGLELIRACSIIPFLAIQPEGPDLCAGLPVTRPQEPVVNLTANNMLYFNWEIPAANVHVLEESLQLRARGFRIAPIEIIRDEGPRYYLSLNFYSSLIAGVVNYRSEWSTYVVRDGDPKPRYLVLEVLSSEAGADPTYPGFIKPASRVTYTIGDDGISVASEDFQAAFALPARGEEQVVHVGEPWAEANDALYWTNGLADKALYNGRLTDADLVSIDPAGVAISNASDWAAFVPGTPRHVLLFPEPLEFAFTPYANLADPSIGLDPAYTGALQAFKSYTFGAYSYGHAFLVLSGLEEPLIRFGVPDDNVPSIFINFSIPRRNVQAFEAALGLPNGFRLSRSKMTARQPAQYLLTLNIYETADVVTGAPVFRAEWSTYVRDQNDRTSDGTFLMVVDVDSSGASLNPVDLFTPPAPVFHYGLEDGRLSADIWSSQGQSVEPKFSVAFDLPAADAPTVRLQDRWILANDRVYWRNGVYDELYYNGLLLDADVVEVDPRRIAIVDHSPWSRYIDNTPTQVLVFRNPLEFVLQPWKNVEERCAPVP